MDRDAFEDILEWSRVLSRLLTDTDDVIEAAYFSGRLEVPFTWLFSSGTRVVTDMAESGGESGRGCFNI